MDKISHQIIKIGEFEKITRYPTLLENYLRKNAIKYGDPRLQFKTKEFLGALIPIMIGIGTIAGITYFINKEQKEYIEKELL